MNQKKEEGLKEYLNTIQEKRRCGKMIQIAPSILAIKDINQLEAELKKLETAGADLIHIDVMDGIFVENKTPFLDPEITRKIKQTTKIQADVHLMVQEPEKYIN